MDLTQAKLTKSEWLNIEVPFPDSEKSILQLIIDGYQNTDVYLNETRSLHSVLKLENNITGLDEYLYKEYFEPVITNLIKQYPNVVLEYKSPITNQNQKLKLKKGHLMRINNMNDNFQKHKKNMFEFILLEIIENMMKHLHNNSKKYTFDLYTLINVKRANVIKTNCYCMAIIDTIIELVLPTIQMSDVLNQAYTFIEKNPMLLKYEDATLYQHQKDIYNTFRYTSNNDGFEDPSAGKFKALNEMNPKLILYTAPTGTGKTLTPLGLSVGYRIIFICAARHVGLALAKSAVCMNKKIAIAFGCETVDDIRLHYYAASEYSINRRTGGIGKVDNTIGDKVEIMICDIKSYLIAMRYMMAFTQKNIDDNIHTENLIEDINEKIEYLREISDKITDDDKMKQCCSKIQELTEKRDTLNDTIINIAPDSDIITYWDEPTISMDYDEHPLHDLIKKVWKDNCISKMVLSCATLPQQSEINDTLVSFQEKFPNATIETISSYDCKKTISLLNEKCKAVLPHLLYSDYDELKECVVHCNTNKSLLRYFDLQEIIKFVNKIHEYDNAISDNLHMNEYFENGIHDITMNSIKLYYLKLLNDLNPDYWGDIYDELYENHTSKITTKTSSIIKPSQTKNGQLTAPANIIGLQITTTDAHTLTDGPTIYLTNNVENLGRYYIQQTSLPDTVYKSIYTRIEQNTAIQTKLTVAENDLEFILDKMSNANDKSKDTKGVGKKATRKINREVADDKQNPNLRKLTQVVDHLRNQIQMVNLDECYIPNTTDHQKRWNNGITENAYSPNISEEDVCNIMALDVDNNKKMLLLLGIGMFTNENEVNPRYMEIMKKLAYEQHLYLILASSDYIYGTNYQFCHGYIGKDLLNMTQQKTIQALGRIGRNNMQQEYTIRFRDDRILTQLFKTPSVNKEAIIMNSLFC
jgi:hypothetical protein